MHHIDSSWYRLVPASSGLELVVPADTHMEKLRCASVIKPLYMWAASKLPPYINKVITWEISAQPAVIESSNQATSLVWEACGQREILQQLTELTHVPWLEQVSAASWGSVRIHSHMVAVSYAKMFAQAGSDQAAQKIGAWMQAVVPIQTFGLQGVVAERLKIDPSQIAVKCGWFLDEDETSIRTHAVTATKLSSGEIVGTVVLTAFEATNRQRQSYKAICAQGDAVLSLHEELAGPALRAENRKLFDVAFSSARYSSRYH